MSSSSLTISRTHYFRLVTGTVTMLSYVHRHIRGNRYKRMKRMATTFNEANTVEALARDLLCGGVTHHTAVGARLDRRLRQRAPPRTYRSDEGNP